MVFEGMWSLMCMCMRMWWVIKGREEVFEFFQIWGEKGVRAVTGDMIGEWRNRVVEEEQG